MKTTKARIEECKAILRPILKPGTTVYCNLRHVSKSGMSRVISLHVIEDGEIRDISYTAAPLLEGYSEAHRGCKAGGCGMDAGFHLVHTLSYALHGDGFGCIGEGCPSNAHNNGDRDFTPHSEQSLHWHKPGGYSLRHRWL